MVNGIIMASGYGKRMGHDKLKLPYKGKPIIEHIIGAARGSKLYKIVLVARDQEIIELGTKHNIKTAINNAAKYGQSESVKLGIKHSANADGYMFLTGDQPLLTSDIIDFLISKFEENIDKIIVPLCSGKRSSPVTFPKDFLEELLKIQGDTGGREVIKNHADRVEFVNIEQYNLLMDIDTYEDYMKIL